jgi:hypothetical protein
MAAAGGFYNENSFLFQQKLDLTQLILIFLFLIWSIGFLIIKKKFEFWRRNDFDGHKC